MLAQPSRIIAGPIALGMASSPRARCQNKAERSPSGKTDYHWANSLGQHGSPSRAAPVPAVRIKRSARPAASRIIAGPIALGGMASPSRAAPVPAIRILPPCPGNFLPCGLLPSSAKEAERLRGQQLQPRSIQLLFWPACSPFSFLAMRSSTRCTLFSSASSTLAV